MINFGVTRRPGIRNHLHSAMRFGETRTAVPVFAATAQARLNANGRE
jgi:hypothetical protein